VFSRYFVFENEEATPASQLLKHDTQALRKSVLVTTQPRSNENRFRVVVVATEK
jgi:hypothetical protein